MLNKTIYDISFQELSDEWLDKATVIGTGLEWIDTQTMLNLYNVIEAELQQRKVMG